MTPNLTLIFSGCDCGNTCISPAIGDGSFKGCEVKRDGFCNVTNGQVTGDSALFVRTFDLGASKGHLWERRRSKEVILLQMSITLCIIGVDTGNADVAR